MDERYGQQTQEERIRTEAGQGQQT